MPSSHSWKNRNAGQPDAPVCWTVNQFAARWQVNRSTIYNWLNRGLLDSVKISGARRILPEHETKFMARFEN